MAKKVAKKSKSSPVKSKSGSQDNALSIFAHLLGIFTSFIGALVIYLASKDSYVRKHAQNALNWQISLLIYYVAAFILMFVYIGVLLMFALVVVNVVFSIIAAVRASEGITWEYPLTIKFIK
jgi:uncharacterized protein